MITKLFIIIHNYEITQYLLPVLVLIYFERGKDNFTGTESKIHHLYAAAFHVSKALRAGRDGGAWRVRVRRPSAVISVCNVDAGDSVSSATERRYSVRGAPRLRPIEYRAPISACACARS